MNCDCSVDYDDSDLFTLALSNGEALFHEACPGGNYWNADCDCDSDVDFDDIDYFVDRLGQACAPCQ